MTRLKYRVVYQVVFFSIAGFSTTLVCRGFFVRVKLIFRLCPVVELLDCCCWNVDREVFVCLCSRKAMGRWMPHLSVGLGLLAALLTCCYAEGESPDLKKNFCLVFCENVYFFIGKSAKGWDLR